MDIKDQFKSLDKKLSKLESYYEIVYETLNLEQTRIICNIFKKYNEVIRNYYLQHITDFGFVVFRTEEYDKVEFKDLIDSIEKENPNRKKIQDNRQCPQCHFDGNRWRRFESNDKEKIEYYTCNYCEFEWEIKKK